MILRRLISVVGVVCLLLFVGAPPALAQPDSVPGSVNIPRLGTLCWVQVRPAPGCRAWIATEIGWEHPIVSSRLADQALRENRFNGRLVTAVGPMFNYQPKAAVGALAVFAPDPYNGWFLLRSEARHRLWIGRRTGIDVGVGFAQEWVPVGTEMDDIKARGISGAIGIEHGIIGIDARVNWLKSGGESHHAGLVGVRTSSYGVLYVYAASFLVYIGLLAAFIIDSGAQ